MKSSLPVVSVIIPCYNHGQYIGEAIGSVLAQTYQSFEIIVVDDGSTDEQTVRVLQGYESDTTIVVIHTENQGPSAARNTGINQARGEYILPLDADDRLAPTFLEQTVGILNSSPEVGIVYSQAELFGEKTGLLELPSYQFPKILLGNMIFSTSLYRKVDWEKVGGYNSNMVWGWEDYDFWLSIIELGREVVHIPEPLFYYRQLPNSRSQKMNQDFCIKSYVQLFHNHSALYKEHIDVVFECILELRKDVYQAHERLGMEIAKAHEEITKAHEEIARTHDRLRSVVTTVRKSPFWRWRNRLLKLKRLMGFKVQEDELLFP